MNDNIILRLEEELDNLTEKIKEYERKSYNIFSSTMMASDRIKYDRLIGTKRGIELSLNVVKSELKQYEIDCLKSKLDAINI